MDECDAIKTSRRRGRPRKEGANAEVQEGQVGIHTGQKEQKQAQADQKVSRKKSSMFARVPTRPDFDPENPVIMYVRVDNTLERLDVQSWETSSDKVYINQRRGMMVNRIIIPLSRISFIQEMKLLPTQATVQQPVQYIPEAVALAQAAPEAVPGSYVVDITKAKKHYERDARKAKRDFYKPEPDEEETPQGGAGLTGADLLTAGRNNDGTIPNNG